MTSIGCLPCPGARTARSCMVSRRAWESLGTDAAAKLALCQKPEAEGNNLPGVSTEMSHLVHQERVRCEYATQAESI